MARILCVDPGLACEGALDRDLDAGGHILVHAATLREGLDALASAAFHVLVVRLKLPDGSGLELLDAARYGAAAPAVFVALDDAELEAGAEALRRGATACIRAPITPEALSIALGGVLPAGPAPAPPAAASGIAAIIGQSAGLRRVLEVIHAVARSAETVLIEGESGTGKDLLARALHDESGRARGPFIAVNCAAMPEGLIESSLFGHERGAFTGASAKFVGAFERAHGGTLLLDEISELRLDLQAKLLRAIQEKQFERVGGTRPVRVDVRIVATSNRDLRAAVEAGTFRRDLYYRIRVIPVRIPPLRERPEDIPLLVRHFIEGYARDLGTEVPEVDPSAVGVLCRSAWPGNVRELQNSVARALLLKKAGLLRLDDFLLDGSPTGDSAAPTRTACAAAPPTLDLRTLERLAIEEALVRTEGNRTRAAKLLGISDRTLRNKINVRPDRASAPRKVVPPEPAFSSEESGSPEPARPAALAA
jgi:two-component system response regulator AtoC